MKFNEAQLPDSDELERLSVDSKPDKRTILALVALAKPYEGWARERMCNQEDPELFYPTTGDRRGIMNAKKVCFRCPVRVLCLKEALEAEIYEGVWGGFSEQERHHLRRPR